MIEFTPTPLIHANVASRLAGVEVYYKLESGNPTGTHKDRESRRIVTSCLENKITEIGCASTGNFAISLAFFAKIYGLKCHVWIACAMRHHEVLDALEFLSATVHFTDADLNRIYALSSQEMAERGIFDANPRRCALKVAANAEIGREIRNTMPSLSTVVCCVNNGTHLIGIGDGLAGGNARMIGVYTHSPFASSITGYHQAEGLERIETAVAPNQGMLIEASDDCLRTGLDVLLKDGVWAEASSASVVGILPRLKFKHADKVCCVISGSGLKKVSENARISRQGVQFQNPSRQRIE